MAITTWENLPKNPLDPTVISEAIQEGIDAHEADPEAHLGAGESLETHRDNEVIDHPAESVVNDKVYQNARRYIAIVDPYNEDDFDTLASAIEYAAVRGGGDIYIRRGTHYVADTINIPPTISLQGDGPGETVITTNGAPCDLYWSSFPGVRPEAVLNGTTGSAGSDILDSTGVGLAPANGYVGLACVLPGDSEPYVIIEELGSNQYKLDRNLASNVGSAQRYFRPAYRATNGSNILEPWPGRNAQDDGIWPGATAMLGGYGNRALLDSVVRDDNIYLAENYTGTTGWFATFAEYQGTYGWYINDITFHDDSEGLYIYHEMDNVFAVVANCAFSGGETWLDLYGGETGPSTYDNCFFQTRNDNQGLRLLTTEVRNSQFEAIKNGAVALNTLADAKVTNCNFASAGYTNHPWLTDLRPNTKIEGCTFMSQGSVTHSDARSTTNSSIKSYVNNYFGMGTSQSITINGGSYIFMANQFNKSSGTPLIFGAGSQRNIFSNNLVVTAPSSAGTGNIISDNATG